MTAETDLLADLGGTNTRVALAGPDGVRPETLRSYRNDDFAGLAAVLEAYLGDLDPGPVRALCAGVAGPVADGTAQLTNREWFIDSAELCRATGAGAAHLINDLQAQGYALDDLPERSITPLFPGRTCGADATRLVMNLGTGCNIAAVYRTGAGLLVPAAEAGHSTLPHATGRAGALLDHLRRTHPHLPVECALSGPGLNNIHRFVSGRDLPPAAIVDAHTGGDSDATETLTLFARLLGTVAGDFALAHLPMGGLFLTGGTARAVSPLLGPLGFHDTFTAKGPYAHILQTIPVTVVTEDSFALAGCARYLRQLK